MSQTVATQLGVPDQPGRPALATLVDALRGETGLLVLDNCEHLVQACARFAHDLLRACPDLHVLATSREPLLIRGETVWRVPSLKLPEPPLQFEQVARAEAVQLFVERAQAADSSFRLTEENASAAAEVCRRLDGIPLAVELAAARISMLSVQQIATRLDDTLGLLVAGPRLAPARQQTVRAALDWSYALLPESEQLLFERLSVFAGGWTLEAAESMAGTDGLAPREVLVLLGRLVDTSMVVVEPGAAGQVRYRLLEALRQQAANASRCGDQLRFIITDTPPIFWTSPNRSSPTLPLHEWLPRRCDWRQSMPICARRLVGCWIGLTSMVPSDWRER